MLLSKQNLFWFSPKASSSSCLGKSWITFLALSLNSITKTVKFLLSGMMAGKFEKSTFNRIWKITAIPLKKKFYFGLFLVFSKCYNAETQDFIILPICVQNAYFHIRRCYINHWHKSFILKWKSIKILIQS